MADAAVLVDRARWDVAQKNNLEGIIMTRSLVCLFLSCCLLPVLSPFLQKAGADSPPNFIIFVADDMAWDDCGAYSHPSIRTPNIDRLASEGMRFDRAFLTCSSCSPSRGVIRMRPVLPNCICRSL